MASVVVFDTRQKRFYAWDLAEPIPRKCHRASLGVFEGPHAHKGAARSAERMQETYDATLDPLRLRSRRAAPELFRVLDELTKAGKMPLDFTED